MKVEQLRSVPSRILNPRQPLTYAYTGQGVLLQDAPLYSLQGVQAAFASRPVPSYEKRSNWCDGVDGASRPCRPFGPTASAIVLIMDGSLIRRPWVSAPLSGLVPLHGRGYSTLAAAHFLGTAMRILPLSRRDRFHLGRNLPQ
jgi:hypothetical protein